eukprot:1102756-Amorphochlora_amoeboformis.AAC.2
MVMHRSGRSAPPLAAIIVAGALAFLAFIAFIPPAQPDQKLGTVMARRMPVARMCEHRWFISGTPQGCLLTIPSDFWKG